MIVIGYDQQTSYLNPFVGSSAKHEVQSNMIQEELLKLLRQGVAVWNRWRMENPAIPIDLSATYLSRYNLQGIHLEAACLRKADLSHTNLSEAYLSGADLQEACLVEADIRMAHLDGANFRRANLTSVQATGVNLRYTDGDGANLSRACLSLSHLMDSRLDHAYLRGAVLTEVDLTLASLCDTDLTEADLGRAILDETNLIGTIFHRTRLNRTRFLGASMAGTILADCNVHDAEGLETIKHQGPSTLGVDTLRYARGSLPDIFLRGIGLPEQVLRSLVTLPWP